MIYTGRQNTFITCKDCVERALGCHDHCEKYKREKKRYDDLKDAFHGDREFRAYMKNQVLINTMPHKHKVPMVRPKSK